MRELTISADECNAVVSQLRDMTQRGPVRVTVSGEIPPESAYGECLKRGALSRLDKDEAAVAMRGHEVFEAQSHVWLPQGVLS